MTAAVSILARLDADGIVAHVKAAASKQHIVASLYVDAVAIGRVVRVAHRYIPHCHILAPERMDIPAG